MIRCLMLGQGLAHLLLVQDVLGVDALPAGVWYVAIDLQLYALVMLCLWLPHTPDPQRRQQLGIILLVVVGLASLLIFNRMPQWDSWAVYFAGSVTHGGVVAGYSRGSRAGASPCWPLSWRWPCGWSSATALRWPAAWHCCCGLAARHPSPWRWLDRAPVRWLAEISYSVFLIHFPVTLLVNAGLNAGLPDRPCPTSQACCWRGGSACWQAGHCTAFWKCGCARFICRDGSMRCRPSVETWLKSRRQPASPTVRPAGAGQAPVRG